MGALQATMDFALSAAHKADVYTLDDGKTKSSIFCLLRVTLHPATTQLVPTATGELGKQTGWT